MRGELREQLNTEITRKQFLQYLAGALLMLFGVDKFIALLTGGHIAKSALPAHGLSTASDGFGSRRFGE